MSGSTKPASKRARVPPHRRSHAGPQIDTPQGGSPALSEAGPVSKPLDLAPNPANPRAPWAPEQVEPFRASLKRFGDLSGVVLNRTTGQLVGGHKRVEAFQDDPHARVVSADGYGYVVLGDGSRFAYREVEWDVPTEQAANLAANKWGAEWDWTGVSQILQSLNASDPAWPILTGFPAHELENLLAADWTAPRIEEMPAQEHPHTLHLTSDHYKIFLQAKEKLSEGESISDGRAVELLSAEYLSGE